jgi:hypothetical protein
MINTQESYLLLCFGKKYIDDAKDLIETLRHFQDYRDINIVVHPQDRGYAIDQKIFNNVISFDISSDPLFHLCNTNFEKFCLLPRLRIPNFLLTKYTIILDTDILCSYFTNNVWKYLINKNQTLIMLGSTNNTNWHWGEWNNICNSLGIQPYETHGGLFFIDNSNSENLYQIWNYVEYAFLNYDNLGFSKKYQNGAVDEPCFSYAFSKTNLVPINFSEYPIMTFNLNALITDMPTKNMTETEQACEMNDYIPFVHMFEKNQSSNFKLLKHKITQT